MKNLIGEFLIINMGWKKANVVLKKKIERV